MLRAKKDEIIESLTRELGEAQSMIVADYRGLGVAQIRAVRNELRPLEASLQVTKNTLARIAAEKAGVTGLNDFLAGPTAIAFCYGDAAPVAKALQKAAKETEILSIRGGIVDGEVLDAAQVKVLATLPSREQLHAQVVVALNSPIAGFAQTLAAIPRGLVIALDQIEKQKAAA